MRKITGLAIALMLAFTSMAAPVSVEPVKSPKPKASEVFVPIGNGMKISLQDLSTIRVKDVETLTGRKLSLPEKAALKTAQRQLSQSINADGTFNTKRLNKFARRSGETGFHLGGFALGFLLGLIGVIITLFINDDYRKNRIKWALIGWLVWIVLYVALYVSLV